MVLRQRLWINLLIFKVFLLFTALLPETICALQPSTSKDQLINALLKLDSEKQQTELLSQNKELLTPELINELAGKANELKLKSEYSEALKIYTVAKEIAAQLNNRIAVAEN